MYILDNDVSGEVLVFINDKNPIYMYIYIFFISHFGCGTCLVDVEMLLGWLATGKDL